ncbi:alpha/beta hydrolase [Marinobacteraceae bacterium S3BR75-40.1]
MYWKKRPSEWPEPSWKRDALVAQLKDFDPEPRAMEPLSPLEEEYCRFYGLDLEVDFPEVEHRLGAMMAGGYRIAVHYYRQPRSDRGTVFVFHGYFDHAGLYAQLFAHLLDQGYNVLCYDLPGHGLSEGDRASIRSFEDYQRVLLAVLSKARNSVPSPWFAVGQSTGGAILIDYLLTNGFSHETATFRGVVLLAPLVRPTGWRSGRLLHSVVSPFAKTWRRVFSENSGDRAFLKFLREYDPLQPQMLALDWVGALKRWIRRIERITPIHYTVTVIQGEKDGTVDWRHNLRVIENKFARTRIHRLPEGHHHLVNESSPLLDKIFAIITDTFESEAQRKAS